MRLLTIACTLALALKLPAAAAPLSVQLRCAKETFLVYEAIPVTVTIQNYTGRPIQLADSDDRSWLSFIVVDDANQMVRQIGFPDTREPLVIPPGQAVSQTIDLLPLYELRDRGSYRVQAVASAGDSSAASTPVRLVLTNGRELWSQVVGLPLTDGDESDEFRTYALVARRGEREDSLYISLRDEQREIVYSLIPLGAFFSTTTPQALADRGGQLHVLFQNGPRSFGYVCVDPFAKVVARAGYSNFQSSPRLITENGMVRVLGGEQVYPRPEPVSIENQEARPVPAPKLKRKKRWWWPFGPG